MHDIINPDWAHANYSLAGPSSTIILSQKGFSKRYQNVILGIVLLLLTGFFLWLSWKVLKQPEAIPSLNTVLAPSDPDDPNRQSS